MIPQQFFDKSDKLPPATSKLKLPLFSTFKTSFQHQPRSLNTAQAFYAMICCVKNVTSCSFILGCHGKYLSQDQE